MGFLLVAHDHLRELAIPASGRMDVEYKVRTFPSFMEFGMVLESR
jgi:hypothetical protein